ncbi:MAG: EF-hand domain-containing protein [Desulfovibrionaceae bacterium]|nr:EF-hand domain-containing protein [Desulfovibrionaceae bacterium]
MKCVLCFVFALGINLPLWARAADAPAPQSVDNSRADERFRNMDTDNKGFITFEDFRKRYPNMQRPAFDAIDGNKDGMINLEEWRTFFQGHGTMGAMPPGHGDTGGQMPSPGHGGGQSGAPLILPPSK